MSERRGAAEAAAAAARGARADEARPKPGGEVFLCDLCGAPMLNLHCKLLCERCGYRRDCSDP